MSEPVDTTLRRRVSRPIWGLAPSPNGKSVPVDRFGLLLALLLTVFLLGSFEQTWITQIVAPLLNAVVLVLVFLGAGLARSWLRVAALAAIGIVALLLTVASDLNRAAGASAWLGQGAILAASVVVIVKRVMSHERVGSQTLFGALCVYVLLGLVFGMVYGAADAVTDEPALFAHTGGSADPVYYSFVTLTTVGFGDVTSTMDLVRRITAIEAMLGQVFLATMVARFVSLYGTSRRTTPVSEER